MLRFGTFLKTLKYAFVNCKPSKKKLYISLTTFVPLFTLNWYNNNYNNSYPALNRNCVVHTQLHTRLTEFLLTVGCFVLPFCSLTKISQTNFLEAEGSHTCLLKNYIATACICAFLYLSVPYACCCWFIQKFDVFVCCVHIASCCVCVFDLLSSC